MSNSVDVGDLCIYCGRSTAPGSGLFVNRIPTFSNEREQVNSDLAAQYPDATTFDGYYCPDCQSEDCAACQAEKNGTTIDPRDYIEATGELCDEHASIVTCVNCREQVEFGQAVEFVLPMNLRHVICPAVEPAL